MEATIVGAVPVAAPVIVANASRLARFKNAAVLAVKTTAGSAVAGVVIGSQVGVMVLTAGATVYGLFSLTGYVVEKVEKKMEERAAKKEAVERLIKKDEASEPQPA